MRKSILLFIVILSSISTFGQQWKETRKQIALSLGVSNFLGDLGGANSIGSKGIKDLDFSSTKLTFAGSFTYFIIKNIAVKTNLIYGWIGGNDRYTQEKYRSNRNLNFRSPIVELSLQAEFYLTHPSPNRQYYNLLRTGSFLEGLRNIPISTYLFVGFGGFYFNPKGRYTDDNWYALQPLCTEGQGVISGREKYSLFSWSLPLGFGVKIPIDKKFTIGIEYGIRFTGTDYIDDCSTTYADKLVIKNTYGEMAAYFSNPALQQNIGDELYNTTLTGEQRGNSHNNDSYMIALISVYYNLGKKQARYFIF